MPQPFDVETYWRRSLDGTDPRFGRFRAFFKRIPSGPRCKTCASPFSGPGGRVMRLIGKSPWEKNPHFCKACYQGLQKNFGGAEIELSMLFADVRGSTGLAEGMSPTEFSALLNRFYRVAVDVLIDADAVIDKFVGDEVVALFIPGLAGPHHARRAIEAGGAILRATGHGAGTPWLPIGVAVHTGRAYVGAVGAEGQMTDFTALGDAVNAAARLASLAGAGETLVSEAAARAAELDTTALAGRVVELRGRSEPMTTYAIPAPAAGPHSSAR
ncbi:MAG TPA: adenylate/guanylate cyclase domain-containing protein [Candidatus Eisenbacteria bacterium]|nr:adenylate/guanylate cyclase domain-containing protein [Candidatus Eisenbacteria bacterium]